MARFIDLDEEGDDHVPGPRPTPHEEAEGRSLDLRALPDRSADLSNGAGTGGRIAADAEHEAAVHPVRIWNPVTEALQCWPIALTIASSIDLNTLDSLARTTYHIHEGLIQYRASLLAATLRCSKEPIPIDPGEAIRYRARASNWFYMEDGRNYNGKTGDCARDMVGGCRRCGDILCRNCTIKPPAPVILRERHRRLCKACVRAPLARLIKPPLDLDRPMTSDVVQRAICTCATAGVWLCQPCGRSIRGTDNDYQRIWRWRSQYGEVLGGLGTGIGDGDRGVTCAREKDCCAAKEREQEIDCDAEDARDNHDSPSSSATPSPSNHLESFIEEARLDRTPSPALGPGYARHEIEGIGGIVKRKLVRMVKIGACVPEYEDEKGPGRRALSREMQGLERSWCGWCWRIIPGKKDLEPGEASSDDELFRTIAR